MAPTLFGLYSSAASETACRNVAVAQHYVYLRSRTDCNLFNLGPVSMPTSIAMRSVYTSLCVLMTLR